jgi:hypothetical protein
MEDKLATQVGPLLAPRVSEGLGGALRRLRGLALPVLMIWCATAAPPVGQAMTSDLRILQT